MYIYILYIIIYLKHHTSPTTIVALRLVSRPPYPPCPTLPLPLPLPSSPLVPPTSSDELFHPQDCPIANCGFNKSAIRQQKQNTAVLSCHEHSVTLFRAPKHLCVPRQAYASLHVGCRMSDVRKKNGSSRAQCNATQMKKRRRARSEGA